MSFKGKSNCRRTHEGAAGYFDRAVDSCRRAGFRRITLRGDTDFTQTEHLDRWDEQGVQFVFGIDAMANLYEVAESLPETARKPLRRPAVKARGKPREKPDNVKEQIVKERGYKNIRLKQEYVAEFSYRPTKCQNEYRVVVAWKDLEESEKQTLLRMDFVSFHNAMIQIPAQIIRTCRRIVYRLLSWNRWQPVLFRLFDQLALPLRC